MTLTGGLYRRAGEPVNPRSQADTISLVADHELVRPSWFGLATTSPPFLCKLTNMLHGKSSRYAMPVAQGSGPRSQFALRRRSSTHLAVVGAVYLEERRVKAERFRQVTSVVTEPHFMTPVGTSGSKANLLAVLLSPGICGLVPHASWVGGLAITAKPRTIAPKVDRSATRMLPVATWMPPPANGLSLCTQLLFCGAGPMQSSSLSCPSSSRNRQSANC